MNISAFTARRGGKDKKEGDNWWAVWTIVLDAIGESPLCLKRLR